MKNLHKNNKPKSKPNRPNKPEEKSTAHPKKDSQIKKELPPKSAIKKSTPSNFDKGCFTDFRNLLKEFNDWILIDNQKVEYSVIIWLDKISDESCLLSIFPNESSAKISNNIDFPICVPISRFPKKNDNLPFHFSQFGLTECDYTLNRKKK